MLRIWGWCGLIVLDDLQEIGDDEVFRAESEKNLYLYLYNIETNARFKDKATKE